MPHFILYMISDFFYFFLYHIIKYRLPVIYENLSNSFPDKTRAEILVIQKAFYKNLMDIILETVKEFSISKKEMKKRFKFINPEVFQEHFNNKKSVMMMMGHFNNWEYGVSTSMWVPQDCWAVYARLENKFMNKYLVHTRERFGFKLYPMEDTYNVMLNHKQGDKLYMFMADQSPHHSKIKYWTDFLHQQTPVHLGAEKLSRMLNMAVVFIDIQKVKRGYYEITASTLFDDAAKTQEYEITNAYFEKLEKIIQENPANWLWSHKRWKYKKGIKY